MTVFKDLSPYNYFEPTPSETELNIGWINTAEPFPKDHPSTEFVHCLWNFCRRAFMQSRGLHECDVCTSSIHPTIIDGRRIDNCHVFKFNGEQKTLGSAEIRVFANEGVIYCAPDLIFHYVNDHEYAPPQEFIDAVISGPHPGTKKYKKIAENYKCKDKWIDNLD